MKTKIVTVLFLCHIVALGVGLIGLLVELPHPELWSSSPLGVAVFQFGIHYVGSLHILLGAATMLLFGLFFVGTRRTLIFFVAATTISLSMELLGTSTGFPFGPYAYTDFLGYKILGHVPFSIPLSWFYMGFTAYVLASLLVARTTWRRQTLWSLLLGAYFLTVWDLSLDPSMASGHMAVQFWVWYTPGPYFGMPISNLVGWTITGLIYMAVSRFFWRSNLSTQSLVAWLPFGVYAANTGFAIVLTVSYGIWPPLFIALLLGLLPAALVLLPRAGGPDGRSGQGIVRSLSHLTVRNGSRVLSRGRLSYRVEGLEQIPQRGPVVIVARHFHHFYDGCILLAAIPRRLHILIALDWVQTRSLRALMEHACALVEWPVVLREERLRTAGQGHRSVYQASEPRSYLLQATRLTTRLLRQQEVVAIFPEAYPMIDPEPSPREKRRGFLPFRPGFARLIALAERDGQTQVAIVPAGLDYSQTREGRWLATARFGQTLFLRDFADTCQLMRTVEQEIHRLSFASAQELSSASMPLQESLQYETDNI
jgi:putative membrane protein